MTSLSEDDAWTDELENMPAFIASQLQVGQVLTERDVKAIQSLLSEIDALENSDIDHFHEGRLSGFREIGGEDLVTAVQMQEDERIAKIVRKAMDRIFPKEQRTRQ